MSTASSAFPGLYRPGLIEVLATKEPGAPSLRRFRGFTAPASLKCDAGSGPATRVGGFRGFTAPASLKSPPRRRGPAPAPCFRGFTAPASLKSSRPSPPMGKSASFPGLYRPGLIEVTPTGCTRRSGSTMFPGLYRPGLIEVRMIKFCFRRTTRFPGLYRPGLIEVAPPPGRSPRRRPGFRGFTAPASLKYECRPAAEGARPRFRGFTAPASLK